ncbi:unnamed protein product [Schistocephalus solidus]|uniref:Apyrase n=1 Tax=Schistocephalus solidus TaxID=70667 RepID=A0A183SW56_SCHSO|nr:unnamed protein product [Schistocephalus solidus]
MLSSNFLSFSFISTEKGISAYALKPEEASATLVPVIQRLLDANVPAAKRKSTRLFLGATAGMRLLNVRHPLYADELLQELRDALSKIGVTVNNVYSDIRIISGDWEGRYAWISVNYLAKKLRDKSDQTPTPVSETVGALDLGGASSQISFVPKPETIEANLSDYKSQVANLQLFGETYRLYSSSFLCYGTEASRMRYLAALIEKVTDPKSGLPKNLKVIGTGDPEECRQQVSSLFDFTTCEFSSCSINGVYQPPIRGKFYVRFVKVFRRLNFLRKRMLFKKSE